MKNRFTANFAALFMGAILFTTGCGEDSKPAPQPQPTPNETTVSPGMTEPLADGSCPEGMEIVQKVAQTFCRKESSESEPPQCGEGEELVDEMCVVPEDPCTACDELRQICEDGQCACGPSPEEWMQDGAEVFCDGENRCILDFDEEYCDWSCGASPDTSSSRMFRGAPHDLVPKRCHPAE